MQHTGRRNKRMYCKCKDARIHSIEDTGYCKSLAAWWPLYRGAGGFSVYIVFRALDVPFQIK